MICRTIRKCLIWKLYQIFLGFYIAVISQRVYGTRDKFSRDESNKALPELCFLDYYPVLSTVWSFPLCISWVIYLSLFHRLYKPQKRAYLIQNVNEVLMVTDLQVLYLFIHLPRMVTAEYFYFVCDKNSDTDNQVTRIRQKMTEKAKQTISLDKENTAPKTRKILSFNSCCFILSDSSISSQYKIMIFNGCLINAHEQVFNHTLDY